MKPRIMKHPHPRASSRARSAALALMLAACSKEPLQENVRPLQADPGGGRETDGASGAAPSTPNGSNTSGSGGTSGAVGAGAAPAVTGGAGSEQKSDPVAFTKRALRQSLAECAVASYGEFASAALELSQATTALAADPSGDAAAARAAWRAAMASWQRAELYRFGPAARSPQPGAQNLRDEIYAFPLANYCRVDQQLVTRSYADAEFASSLSSARGLAALEYLLFYEGSESACSSAVAINVSGDWAALAPAELTARRSAYAARAAADVAERAAALVAAWSPEGGDFQTQFIEAGRSGSVFASEQQAFNAVSDALLYLEKEVKDWKLGWPLGLVPECLNAPSPCPSDVESRYARLSGEQLRQNLAAFRAAFAGCGSGVTSLGFDDWLGAVGAADLSRAMLEALERAELAAAATGELEVALVTDIDSVRALHAAVKGVTDLLKTEFITVLDFELPMALEGDND